ncbi:F-box domain-containing protein [Blumeria hordei DH14]|uniref:F-box domain-containing protein n=1 Tax=Blumeria graminis f. sp. hordei (strain DH14) TaxID=546991 RepID=N1JB87_BLUG1|nr:F-box domain-containing protein [Blumeria hordei DH14]
MSSAHTHNLRHNSSQLENPLANTWGFLAPQSSQNTAFDSPIDSMEETALGSPKLGKEKCGKGKIDPRAKISDLLKDREIEWTAIVAKKGPLQILDLPIDILKLIVKEITHTNDLTALALTHSALHGLAIPPLYSRFDIVWPDALATTNPRTGVDALTYGLATLCMGDSYHVHNRENQATCSNCGAESNITCWHGLRLGSRTNKRGLGNHYSQYTRKFSLGNGPTDWVQDYLITKESGKMLGTLVAIAVARMINLETFVWDMPTGVLRDVWLALSSLQKNSPNGECRLERVWVRWHDNSESTILSAAQRAAIAPRTTPQMLSERATMTSIGWKISSNNLNSIQAQAQPIPYANSRVEYPNLSVLPSLKSLSVLDIDEIDYLEEMSVLIEKSQDCLRELRVGISSKAVDRDFTIPWDGPGFYQVDHKACWSGASRIGEKRLGGVLGIITGRIFDIRRKTLKPNSAQQVSSSTSLGRSTHQLQEPSSDLFQNSLDRSSSAVTNLPHRTIDDGSKEDTVQSEGLPPSSNTANSNRDLRDEVQQAQIRLEPIHTGPEFPIRSMSSNEDNLSFTVQNLETSVEGVNLSSLKPRMNLQDQSNVCDTVPIQREKRNGKLKLQTLELEMVPLSIAVLQRAFDWSNLTSLTILDCPQHERLWEMLRKNFSPTPLSEKPICIRSGADSSLQYHLNLKKVHTDAASPALISFLKETLAPNSLETLFLQDRKRNNYNRSRTQIDAIYRGPLRRHRASLKRLMLDSSDKVSPVSLPGSDSSQWMLWMPNRKILNFITSGRMSNLRELSMAIDYKDWHHFLQRLPQVPHLRSLNIPYIAEHATTGFDPRELALQIVDVIVLRPEIELCYMGILHKCFEILETQSTDEAHGNSDPHSSTPASGSGDALTDEEDDNDEDGDDDEDDNFNNTVAESTPGINLDETDSEMSEYDSSDTDSFECSEDNGTNLRLRLREILFYDDKVAIFKARHGRL